MCSHLPSLGVRAPTHSIMSWPCFPCRSDSNTSSFFLPLRVGRGWPDGCCADRLDLTTQCGAASPLPSEVGLRLCWDVDFLCCDTGSLRLLETLSRKTYIESLCEILYFFDETVKCKANTNRLFFCHVSSMPCWVISRNGPFVNFDFHFHPNIAQHRSWEYSHLVKTKCSA